MGGAGAADRDLPARGEGATAEPAPDDQRDRVASPERGEVASGAGRAGTVVEARAVLHPLVQAWRVGAASTPGAAGPGEAEHDVPGRHQHPCTSEGRRRSSKDDTADQRDEREALGRSRGGFGTKACVITDAIGRAMAFVLGPGQDHELPHAIPLLDQLPGVPGWVVADRAYSSHAFREYIWDLGARPVIPTRRNEEALSCPSWIYTNRNQVERLWARVKEWRAVATRYEKTARSFMGILCLAAAFDWVKP